MIGIDRCNQVSLDGEALTGRFFLGGDDWVKYKSKTGRETLAFRARIVEAKDAELLVRFEVRRQNQVTKTGILSLQGTWKADRKGRLVFDLEKTRGRGESLRFHGKWHLNRRHQIVYTPRYTKLRLKIKKEKTIVLDGYWDILEGHRLTYFLKGSSKRFLCFRGAFQNGSILARKGAIRYQIPAAATSRKSGQMITLFGKWKFSRLFDLDFEMDYGGHRLHIITFTGSYRVDSGGRVVCRLQNGNGRKLGPEVILTQDHLKDHREIFLRLSKRDRAARNYGGHKAVLLIK